MKKKTHSFWKPERMKYVNPNPKLSMNLVKDSRKLVKTGIGVAVAGAALGAGLAAYKKALNG